MRKKSSPVHLVLESLTECVAWCRLQVLFMSFFNHLISRRCQSSRCQSSRCQSSRCQSSRCQSSRCQSSRCQSSRCQSSRCQSSRCQSSRCQSSRCQSINLFTSITSCLAFLIWSWISLYVWASAIVSPIPIECPSTVNQLFTTVCTSSTWSRNWFWRNKYLNVTVKQTANFWRLLKSYNMT